MPRPYDPTDPDFSTFDPDQVTAGVIVVEPPPAPAPAPQQAPAAQPDYNRVEHGGPADGIQPTERWAFSTRTVQRIMVAGIMFVIAERFATLRPFVDQQLVQDTVKMMFDGIGLLFLGAAGRARQLAAPKGPEKLYWLPRRA